jgi:hypothetical protein
LRNHLHNNDKKTDCTTGWINWQETPFSFAVILAAAAAAGAAGREDGLTDAQPDERESGTI